MSKVQKVSELYRCAVCGGEFSPKKKVFLANQMIITRKGKWLVFLLLLSFLVQKGWAAEGTQVFTGEGVAFIEEAWSHVQADENVFAARDEALKKARINALERAMEKILPFEVIEEKGDVILSAIFSDLKTYLLATKIVKEKEEDGLYYKVTIRATIDLDALKKMVREIKDLCPCVD